MDFTAWTLPVGSQLAMPAHTQRGFGDLSAAAHSWSCIYSYGQQPAGRTLTESGIFHSNHETQRNTKIQIWRISFPTRAYVEALVCTQKHMYVHMSMPVCTCAIVLWYCVHVSAYICAFVCDYVSVCISVST